MGGGVAVFDFNNDGFKDLFITTAENKRCYLLKNDNGISFEDVYTASGITDEAWSSTTAE